jgi:hypothetical protein
LIKLNRMQCFLIGIGIIFLFYFLNRTKYIFNSEKVQGKFIFYVSENDSLEGKLFYPVVEYEVKGKVYRFRGREGASYELNEELPVLLKDHDPERPVLYTIGSFWLYPLFYVILPVIIWAAFSLSYVNKNEKVVINLKYPFFKKENEGSGSKELAKK